MNKKLLMIIVIAILFSIITACNKNEISNDEIKQKVIMELENRYEDEFEITNIQYEPMTEEYEIDAVVVDKPELDFTFAVHKSSFSEDPPRDDDIKNIHRGVIAEYYRTALQKLVNEAKKDSMPQLELKWNNIFKPVDEDYKDPKFAKMNFNEFAAEYKEENVYHLYFLTKDEYANSYISENEEAIKSFLSEISKQNLKTIKIVIIFPNDVYVESDVVDIKTLLSQPLNEIFMERKEQDPQIPGFDYEKWKKSLM
jgi:hypothetical protein